jgi:hypothetical protein
MIEVSSDQRSFILDMAVLLMPEAKRKTLAYQLVNAALSFEDAFMCEVTEDQASWIVERAHAWMTAAMRKDSNAWLSWDYISMEQLAYAVISMRG